MEYRGRRDAHRVIRGEGYSLVSGKEAESALLECFHGAQGLCVPVERKK
jgi:hypothetical protein